MATFIVATSATITGGTANGVITVADTTGFYKGASVWLSTPRVKLDYKILTGAFTVGQVVTGTTSTNHGVIASIAITSPTTGTLTLNTIVGTFLNGEPLTDPLGGAATSFGNLYASAQKAEIVEVLGLTTLSLRFILDSGQPAGTLYGDVSVFNPGTINQPEQLTPENSNPISAGGEVPVTIGAFGATPAAGGATIDAATQVLTLQPADATHPGLVTTGAQTFAGTKSSAVASGSDAFKMLDGARFNLSTADANAYLYRASANYIYTPSTLGGAKLISTGSVGVGTNEGTVQGMSNSGNDLYLQCIGTASVRLHTSSGAEYLAATTNGINVATLDGTLPAGTGSTVPADSSSRLASVVHKVTVTFANLATGAGATKDTTIWTVPAKTKVMRVIADVTAAFTGGTIASGNVKVGKTAGGAEYLTAGDMFTAPAVYGDTLGEEGASLSAGVGDIPAWAATQAISARFTVGGDTVDHCTAGSCTFYIETIQYP